MPDLKTLGRIASTASSALSWAGLGALAAFAVIAVVSNARTSATSPAPSPHAADARAAPRPTASTAGPTATQPVVRSAAVRTSAKPPAQPDAPITDASSATTAAPATDDASLAPAEPPAALTQWTDADVTAALKECLTLLAPIAAGLDVSEPMRAGDCGSPAPVSLRSVGSAARVEMKPATTLNCRMVARLHDWVETTLQPAARTELGSPVVRIIGSSGYSCRNRYGLANAPISEHAFANAIDIGGFVLADGRTVSVLGAWGPTARDTTKDKDAAKLAKATKSAVTELRTKVAAAAEAASHPPAPASAAGDGKPTSPERPSISQHVASLGAKTLPGRSALGHPPPSPAAAARAASEIGGPAAPSPGGSLEEPATASLGASPGARPGAKDASKSKGGAGKAKAAPKETDAAAKDAKENKDAKETEREAERARLADAQSRFLKRLHAGACRSFATVLGPEANEAHRDHFHFDLKERRTKVAVCQ